MTGEPANDAGRFVRAVVVQHQVDLAGIRRNCGIHCLHEFQELLVAMAPVTLADYFAGCNVQGGE